MTTQPEEESAQEPSVGPVPLDGMAYGIDYLDAILVFHLGDAHLHAAWVRADAGLRAEEVVGSLRDAYRVCQFASRRLSLYNANTERRGEAQNPMLTLELVSRVALLRRIRSHVVAVLFDGAMPLGMARLVAGRLAATLEPELPRMNEGAAEGSRAAAPRVEAPPAPEVRQKAEDDALTSVVFSAKRGSRPPMPRVTLTELDRTRRLLTYLETHAPEAHVVRLRLALRTGLTPLALEHPETLGADAVVLIETAVEDMLGVDRTELRSLV